jgi:hypothetical protein
MLRRETIFVMKNRIDARCCLCGGNDELRKSHVIPEWLYGPLYDEIHRYRVIEAVPGDRQ